MELPGRSRIVLLTIVALSLSGCASVRPRVADETKVEEWARCARAEPARFTVLCLETRRPL
jgi:type IV pilus biogenesis protein CpaD/CtpE